MDLPPLTQDDIIILVESTQHGRPGWWYVKCDNRLAAEKLKAVCHTKVLDTIQFEKYGMILRSGWGQHPPESVTQELLDHIT